MVLSTLQGVAAWEVEIAIVAVGLQTRSLDFAGVSSKWFKRSPKVVFQGRPRTAPFFVSWERRSPDRAASALREGPTSVGPYASSSIPPKKNERPVGVPAARAWGLEGVPEAQSS